MNDDAYVPGKIVLNLPAPTQSCSHAKSSTVFVIIHSSGIGRANGEITSKYPQG